MPERNYNMKYLKRFNESYTDDIRSNIKDILLPLEDNGIYNDIMISLYDVLKQDHKSMQIAVSLLSIDLYDQQSKIHKPFNVTNDVLSTLRHLDSYLQSEGLQLSSISFRAKDRDSDMQNGGLQNDGAKTWEEFGEYLTRWGYHQFESLIIRYK